MDEKIYTLRAISKLRSFVIWGPAIETFVVKWIFITFVDYEKEGEVLMDSFCGMHIPCYIVISYIFKF